MMIHILVLAGAVLAADTPVRGRQPVIEVQMSVNYRCAGGEYRWAVGNASESLGPDLSVDTGKSAAGYLYLSEAGYRVFMEGNQAGAKITLNDTSTANRLPFAVLDPAETRCAYEGAQGRTSARIKFDPAVRADLEVKPRTGIFRPACYKNITTGHYVLELWKIATLMLPDRSIELKSASSAVFGDKEKCRKYYEAF